MSPAPENNNNLSPIRMDSLDIDSKKKFQTLGDFNVKKLNTIQSKGD